MNLSSCWLLLEEKAGGVGVNRADLVRQAKKGDKDALVQMVMAEKTAFYQLAYSYLRNREDSMDALSDMILVLYEKISQLNNEEAFYSWSKTILVNRCKQILKLRKRTETCDDSTNSELENAGTADVSLRQVEHRMVLEKPFSKLSDNHQDVIRLFYYLDYNQETIAKILKIPVGTVKSRLSNGLKQLRLLMGGEGND